MYKHWSHDKVRNRYLGVFDIADNVPAGVYNCYMTTEGPLAMPATFRSDAILHFTHGPSAQVMQEIESFWESKDHYRKLQVSHKRGILLHGPAGCGKTGIVGACVQDHIAKEGVVLLGIGDPEHFRSAMRYAKQIEGVRPALVVMEDIEDFIHHDEEEFLEMMDGSTADADGVLFLGTTNSLQEIPKRVRCRPSRIDTLIEVGFPDQMQRFEYLLFLLQADPLEEREKLSVELSEKTKDFSLAMLKELVLSVRVYRKSVDASIQLLRQVADGE